MSSCEKSVRVIPPRTKGIILVSVKCLENCKGGEVVRIPNCPLANGVNRKQILGNVTPRAIRQGACLGE